MSAAEQRQKIIDSVFTRRNAASGSEESYVAHVKIWEDAGPEGGGRKPRYIILSEAKNGSGFLHKSKLNSNGTFSVGKTWKLSEVRAVQVVNPLAFNITLSRTYKWQTENQADQAAFLKTLVHVFHTLNPSSSLQLDGLSRNETELGSQLNTRRPVRAPSPGLESRRTSQSQRPQTPTQSNTRIEPNSIPRTNISPPQVRIPSRAPSPSPAANPYLSPTANGSTSTAASNAWSSLGLGSSQSTLAQPTPSPSHLTSPSTFSQRSSSHQHQASSSIALPDPRSASPAPPAPRARKVSAREPISEIAPRRDRDQNNARISFFDPSNQNNLDRLLANTSSISADGEGEDENSVATVANVEEMIEGYEWASDDVIARKTSRGAADLIEARLLDELMALEKANIHSFLEPDDRLGTVMKFIDEAILELDNMDSLVSSYKIHLNTVTEDIQYIQSQNRGLQVVTQNQRMLLNELENLLTTVHVDEQILVVLTQESLEKSKSIERLEEAAVELYKALQAGRDTDMAATMERLQEYQTHNAQFCKRLLDFLSIMFTAQATMLLGDKSGLQPGASTKNPSLINHGDLEAYLGRYSGLMLYLKEMDETVYGKLCAAYFSSVSNLHGTQMKALLSSYAALIRNSEDPQEISFSPTQGSTISKGAAGTIRRAGTMIRSPIDSRNRDKDKPVEGSIRVSEAFSAILGELTPAVYRENAFISDFLQINDAGLTYADYMGLDSYFRRQAARSSGLSQSTLKLVRGAMDLIFGFLPAEFKTWLDNVLAKDPLEVIGVIGVIERFIQESEERGNQFLQSLLNKQHTRMKAVLDRHVKEQISEIEQTKISAKKRTGVAHFVKQFPAYVTRVEQQLVMAEELGVRILVDSAYEKIMQSIFDSLKHMAKLDGESEDKGQLNYHVILIENMHHFNTETATLEVASIRGLARQAKAIYEENLTAYVKLVLRRPFARIIDYFDGVERALKNTSPVEVANNSIYSKSALKKVVKEHSAKDVRKSIDALFLRVAKHFNDEFSNKPSPEETGIVSPGSAMFDVWNACKLELIRLTESFANYVAQCYPDSGVNLDYSVSDVEAGFKRHLSLR